ncbi:LEM domain-containing protein [Trichonephila inaurata madagascariensis]|uniref:LEM domain-containing protein n=1 Tax=Trichonephila inaurata madagascariensis TaxID=2747483 RepID=A0A8X7CBL5_9ARAC|nr:LEM domain-containing protein [Trichonephila inaurata madagascariensis]
MANLTDEQLGKLLKDYGEDVGPLNDITRPLWEKRLKDLKNSQSQKFGSPKNYTSNSDTENTPRGRPRKDRIVNRSSSVDRLKVTSLNSSEEITSSFELDSPLIGEPGNSPYPFRVKPRTTNVKKKKNRRVFEVESPNSKDEFKMHAKKVISSELMSHLNNGQLRKLMKVRGEDEGSREKELFQISAHQGDRLMSPERNFSADEMRYKYYKRQECNEDEQSTCDEEYFAAEDSIPAKATFRNIRNVLNLLLRGVAFAFTASLLILLMMKSWNYQIDENSEIIWTPEES